MSTAHRSDDLIERFIQYDCEKLQNAFSCKHKPPQATIEGGYASLKADSPLQINQQMSLPFNHFTSKRVLLSRATDHENHDTLLKMPPKFKPAVSALARQTIKTAFDELDRTITPVDSRDFATTTLEHVRNAALEIETQLAAKQSLRNLRRLMPLFQGLEHYAKVVDVLCNGTPFLPWIWAPITLILRLASEYVEAFEAIMKGYSKIAESLVRFEILQQAFTGNPGFQQTLAVFYSDILQFHKFAYTFLCRSSTLQTYNSVVNC